MGEGIFDINKIILSKSIWILGIILSILGMILLYLISGYYFEISKWFLEFSFIIIVIISYYYFYFLTGSKFSIHSLFLSLFIFFLGSRVILDFLGYSDFHELTYYKEYTLSNNTACRVILNLNIAVLAYLLGVIIFYLKKGRRNLDILRSHSSIFTKNKLIDILFIIGLIYKIFFSVRLFLAIMEKGYLSIFQGEIEIEKNILEWFIESFSLVGLFVYFNRERLMSKWLYACVILYAILSMATGQRGIGLIFIVFSLFYLNKIGKLKITKIKILVFIALLYIVSVVIELLRRKIGDDSIDYSILIEGIPNFFWGQGVSISIIAYSIDYNNSLLLSFSDMFGNLRYVFEYYTNKVIGNPMPSNMINEYALNYKFFSSYISCITNPKLFKLGYGIGGSYIAQLFVLGQEYIQLVGGVIVGYLMSLFYSFLSSNKIFVRFLGFSFLLSFIYIPRDNLFDFLTENWIVYFSMLFYLVLVWALYKVGIKIEKI